MDENHSIKLLKLTLQKYALEFKVLNCTVPGKKCGIFFKPGFCWIYWLMAEHKKITLSPKVGGISLSEE